MLFVCKQCGVEFEGKPNEKNRIFCSKNCLFKYRKEGQQFCPHNPGVICDDRYYCFKCGWNPAVEQRRKEVLV